MHPLHLVHFSPTQTTARVLQAIAHGMAQPATVLDITHQVDLAREFAQQEVVVVGVPVYGGRVPALAAQRLAHLTGNGTPAVAVVVYGNRAYEDALLELQQLLAAQGFDVVAAAAFIGEHSFSTPELPIAQHRPDAADLAKAAAFGQDIVQAITQRLTAGIDTSHSLALPGNTPYKERSPSSRIVPQTDPALCGGCMSCVDSCPTGAISPTDPCATDADLCIRCAACIKGCPSGARAITHTGMLDFIRTLQQNCQTRREPECFV